MKLQTTARRGGFFCMPIERLHITDFLKKSSGFPIIDVRSPGEFEHAHIPGAISIPLFNNEERAIIGTAYTQKGRGEAVDLGLNFFSTSMKNIPAKALETFKTYNQDGPPVFFVHCWRGGMRSDAVAWLLNLYGYKIFLLKGGYKSYRRWVLEQFAQKRNIRVLGGFTGSGKTEILHALKEHGACVIDLEGIAHHKGSSFGALGMPLQPTQEMFENTLGCELGMMCREDAPVWIEDESPNVGMITIPNTLWRQMRTSDIYFLEIPFSERLNFISSYYGKFQISDLKDAILRIRKRLGGLETQNAIHHLEKGDMSKCFEILLRHYDKVYEKSLNNHLNDGAKLHKIPCTCVDSDNAEVILKSGLN